METLTTMEEIRLRNLEAIITKGEQTFVDVANALQEICEKRLYRKDCGTFEEYMWKKWHRSARWANTLIKSSTAVQGLPKEISTTVLKLGVNENTARAISNVPQEKRAKVVEEALKNGHLTSKSISIAAKAVVSPKDEKVEDDMGTIIPKDALPIWNRRHEIKEMMLRVSAIRTEIRANQKVSEDHLWNAVNSNCTTKLDNAYNELRVAYPEVVCGTCQGFVPKVGCSTCSSTGFQSKSHYEMVIPMEDRKMRKAAIEERKAKNAAKGLPTAVSRLNP